MTAQHSACLVLLCYHICTLPFTASSTEPRFAETIHNVTVVKGRDMELNCLTENLGDYKVAWVKVDTQTILTIGSHLITRNYRISLSSSDKRIWSLRVAEARRQDEGWYMCQINTNPMKLQAAFLQVVEPPDIITDLSSEDQLALEGEPVLLRCVARGHPEPLISWRRQDNIDINTLAGVQVNGTDVIIPRVQRQHMGVYFCVASNEVPPSVSKRLVLHVQFAPQLRLSSQTVRASRLLSTRLQCHVEAFPSAVTYWLSSSRHVLTEGERYELSEVVSGYHATMSLSITPVLSSDFSTYLCVAKNPLGEVKGSIKLVEHLAHEKERMTARRKHNQHHRKAKRKKETTAKEEDRRNPPDNHSQEISKYEQGDFIEADIDKTKSSDGRLDEYSGDREHEVGQPDSAVKSRVWSGLPLVLLLLHLLNCLPLHGSNQ